MVLAIRLTEVLRKFTLNFAELLFDQRHYCVNLTKFFMGCFAFLFSVGEFIRFYFDDALFLFIMRFRSFVNWLQLSKSAFVLVLIPFQAGNIVALHFLPRLLFLVESLFLKTIQCVRRMAKCIFFWTTLWMFSLFQTAFFVKRIFLRNMWNARIIGNLTRVKQNVRRSDPWGVFVENLLDKQFLILRSSSKEASPC